MSAIHTFTGKQIDPCHPAPDALCIEDIAHALSLVCRAGGHFRQYYSVCQHCVACTAEAKARGMSRRVQLLCLLHDGSEAYLSDITRPVKAQLPQYFTYEAQLQSLIYETFAGGVPEDAEQAQISAVDDAMLRAEFLHFMDVDLLPQTPALLSAPDFSFVPFDTAAQRFLNLYASLTATA